MYGENGEVEYGGDMKNAYKPDRSVEDQLRHYFSELYQRSFLSLALIRVDKGVFCS